MTDTDLITDEPDEPVMKAPADLAAAMIARLDEKYDLIYVQYDDKLYDKQVDALVAGEWETFYGLLEDFESDSMYSGAKYEIEQLHQQVIADWSNQEPKADLSEVENFDAFVGTDEFDEVRFAMSDRDNGDWLRTLAGNAGRVLMRVTCISEDHSFAFREVTPEQVLDAVGFEHTEHNLKAVADGLAKCSPEHSVLMGYWVWGADVETFLDLHDGQDVEVTNPYLYLGNPFAGSGWIFEDPLHGTVRIKRDDLRTDKDAFGYSLNDVYGGLSPSSFPADMRPIPSTTDTTKEKA